VRAIPLSRYDWAYQGLPHPRAPSIGRPIKLLQLPRLQVGDGIEVKMTRKVFYALLNDEATCRR